MKQIKVLQLDAFTKTKNRGNPAGVVIVKDKDNFTEAQMQLIAKKVGFNETVFIETSHEADYRFRYFTPGHEMNLCGHATIAGVYALYLEDLLQQKTEVVIATNIGVIKVQIMSQDKDCILTMEQDTPKFVEFEGNLDRLADVLSIEPEQIIANEIIYGSTGTWTLLVPVKSDSDLTAMIPKTQNFPEVLTQMPKTSIHPYTLENFAPHNLVIARHFSSPYSGTVEDPVTGTASGVIAAYLLEKFQKKHITIKILQGKEMEREGTLQAYAWKENKEIKVNIEGVCVYNQELAIDI